MTDRERDFAFEVGIIIAGMTPVALLALALMLR